MNITATLWHFQNCINWSNRVTKITALFHTLSVANFSCDMFCMWISTAPSQQGIEINGKQMLYPAESQVIDGITNQRVNLTLGNHNMYILFFSAGNREQRKLFFKLGHFFFQKHKNKETVLPFPKYRVRDTTNCKLDLWGIKNYLHYS